MALESSVTSQSIPWAGIAQTPVGGSADSFADWIDGLRSGGVRQAAPALLLALSNLARADISPSRRTATLRLIKTPLLKTCSGLPKPWEAAVRGLSGRGITLEQRLYRAMFQNLIQALHQLDRCYFVLDARQARRRDWLIRNLFKFFQRQVRYAALWGTALPSGSWHDIHDLYVYLMVRRGPLSARGRASAPVPRIDAELEYKQLLLFGLTARLTKRGARNGALMNGLREWARQSLLEDPQGMYGDTGLLIVDLSADEPPREHSGSLDADFRGWVLIPPASFLHHVDQERAAENGRLDDTPAPTWPTLDTGRG